MKFTVVLAAVASLVASAQASPVELEERRLAAKVTLCEKPNLQDCDTTYIPINTCCTGISKICHFLYFPLVLTAPCCKQTTWTPAPSSPSTPAATSATSTRRDIPKYTPYRPRLRYTNKTCHQRAWLRWLQAPVLGHQGQPAPQPRLPVCLLLVKKMLYMNDAGDRNDYYLATRCCKLQRCIRDCAFLCI